MISIHRNGVSIIIDQVCNACTRGDSRRACPHSSSINTLLMLHYGVFVKCQVGSLACSTVMTTSFLCNMYAVMLGGVKSRAYQLLKGGEGIQLRIPL